MAQEIIFKQEKIPPLNQHTIAVKHIEYYPSSDGIYDEAKITPELIEKILKEIPKGIEILLFLDPDGECDFMEVLSDGEWVSLGCFFEQAGDGCYYSYNADYANTANEVEKFNYSDSLVWTKLVSGGQSPIPKIQSITDIQACIKAVEYFIWTGELYPGIDWLHES